MFGLVGLIMLIMYVLLMVNKKLLEVLIVIGVVLVIVIFGQLDVVIVGSFICDGGGEGLKGGLFIF